MRPNTDDIKTNGMTRTNYLSVLTHRQKDSSAELGLVFSFFLSALFLRRNNGAVWLSHIATNLFATLAKALPMQTNPLQLPAHKIGVLCALFARALDLPKSAPQEYGFFLFKQNLIDFKWAVLGYP